MSDEKITLEQYTELAENIAETIVDVKDKTEKIFDTFYSEANEVDCSALTEYNISDGKIYIFTNIGTLNLTAEGEGEKHFFLEVTDTSEITMPNSWTEIVLEAGTLTEVSVLNDKAVYKAWTIDAD